MNIIQLNDIYMKTTAKSFVGHAIRSFKMSLLAIFTLTGISALTQTLTTEFLNAGYVLTDLGSVDQLPSRYGGLTHQAGSAEYTIYRWVCQ